MFQLRERVRRLLKWLSSPVPVRRGPHRFIPFLEAGAALVPGRVLGMGRPQFQ
jgi:hypothetical protein